MFKFISRSICFLVLISSVTSICKNSFAEPPLNSMPVPQETLVVLMLRPAQMVNDPQLKSLASDFDVVFQNIQALGLNPQDIDEAVLFAPFDLGMVYGGGGFPDNLNSTTGLILRGKFNSDSKIRDLKSKGWKESQFDKKRVLFWSSGESYLCAADGSKCLSSLKGDRIVIGGSQDVVKNVINASNGKIADYNNDPFFKRVSDQFRGNGNIAISAFAVVTDQMRALIKPPPPSDDTTGMGSKAASAAIMSLRSYSNHVKELGLTLSGSGSSYELGSALNFDNDNSAMMVSGLLQFGGSLASFLPPNNPARPIISGLVVSRDGQVLNLQSVLSKKQFNDIFMRHK